MPTDRGPGSARLLTIDQAADRLGCDAPDDPPTHQQSPAAVRQVGRTRRISEFEVGRFVEASTVAAIDRRDRYWG